MNCEYIIQYIKRYGNHSLINLSNIENRDEIKCYNLKMIAHQNVEKHSGSQKSKILFMIGQREGGVTFLVIISSLACEK